MASERDSGTCASAPAVEPDVQPPSTAAGWFVGDIQEWRMWRISGQEPLEYPTWRKSHLDRRMREIGRMRAPEEAHREGLEEEADDMDQKRA